MFYVWWGKFVVLLSLRLNCTQKSQLVLLYSATSTADASDYSILKRRVRRQRR